MNEISPYWMTLHETKDHVFDIDNKKDDVVLIYIMFITNQSDGVTLHHTIIGIIIYH